MIPNVNFYYLIDNLFPINALKNYPTRPSKESAKISVETLVFIDESEVNLKQSQAYARAFYGNRIKLRTPFLRGKKYSMIGAVTCTHVLAATYGE